MRTISPSMLHALMAQHSDVALLDALVVSHPTIAANPLYFVRNNESIVFEGHTYVPLGFRVRRAPDTEDAPPMAEVVLDNVSLQLVELLRSINTPITVSLSLLGVRGDGTVERVNGPADYSLLNVTMDKQTITGRLGFDMDLLNTPGVSVEFIPAWFPGLFA